jgi:hypothetical protein
VDLIRITRIVVLATSQATEAQQSQDDELARNAWVQLHRWISMSFRGKAGGAVRAR